MNPNVSLEFSDLFKTDGADVTPTPDPFRRFFEAAHLRGAGVESSELHSTEIEDRFRKLHNVERWQQAAKAANIGEARRAAQNEWEETITAPEYQKLEKTMSGERRKLALREWLRGELSLGKSAADLIEHAEKFDPEIAGVLAELASELQAIA